MTDLLARLASATEGSRELDAAIWMALVECDRAPFRYWAPVDEHHGHGEPRPGALYYAPHCAQVFVTPAVTTSLDAALALAERVLSSWSTDVHTSPPEMISYPIRKDMIIFDDGECEFRLSYCHPKLEPREIGEGYAATPALALCIAVVRAKLGGDEGRQAGVNPNQGADQ